MKILLSNRKYAAEPGMPAASSDTTNWEGIEDDVAFISDLGDPDDIDEEAVYTKDHSVAETLADVQTETIATEYPEHDAGEEELEETGGEEEQVSETTTEEEVEPAAAAPEPTTSEVTEDDEFLSQPISQPEQQSTSDDVALRARSLSQLESYYKLSDDERSELEDNITEALPKLLARVHYDAMRSAMRGILNNMPVLVQGAQKQETAQQKLDQTFYGRWPKLNTTEGRQTVESFKSAFLKQNPGMSLRDYIDNVGAAAMVRLKLPMETAAVAAPAPAAPAAPAGHRPAQPGGSRAARQVAAKPKTMWDDFDAAFEYEDSDD